MTTVSELGREDKPQEMTKLDVSDCGKTKEGKDEDASKEGI